ncbi:hypothetical protein UF34_16485 [Vibrio parahaemolyticus]|nr:hypothetical protein UF34_16485 [Vibrio parahaemolyticus]
MDKRMAPAPHAEECLFGLCHPREAGEEKTKYGLGMTFVCIFFPPTCKAGGGFFFFFPLFLRDKGL